MLRRICRLSMLVLVVVAAGAGGAGAQSRSAGPPQALPPFTLADTLPPPPGAEHLAWLASLEFDPPLADSLRRGFMAGFRGAFAEGAYATERERRGHPVASMPQRARFRLLEGTGGWGVWNAQVVLRSVRPRSPSDGPSFEVTIAALDPKAVAAGARPIPATMGFALDDVEPRSGARGPGAARPQTPRHWWSMVGRTVGLLVLEQLHLLSGDLDDDAHFLLGPARRVESAGPQRPPKR